MTLATLTWADLFDAMPLPAVLLDEGFRIVASNARFRREFDFDADALRDRPAADLLVPRGVRALASIRSRLQHAPPDHGLAFDTGVRAANGRIEARQANARSVFGDHRGRLVLVQFEPPARSIAPARPDGAEWHRVLFEESPLPKLLLDGEHRIVDANDAALAMTGFSLDELVGRDPASLVDADSRARVIRARMSADPARERAAARYRLRTRLGGVRAVHALVQPAPDPSGGTVEVVTLLDDTDLPSQRQQFADALLEQRFLLESIAVGVALVVEGRIVHASGPFGRCLGTSAQSLAGQSAGAVLGNAAWQQLQDAVTQTGTNEPPRRVHVGLLGADGAWRELVLCARRVARHSGPPGVVVSAFDVTQRSPDDAQRLAALERQRDALVRQVHHHVKNGLFGVVGMLQAQAMDEPEIARALSTVAGRLAAIAELHGLEAQDAEAGGASLGPLLRGVLAGLDRVYGCRVELHEATGSEGCERLVAERARIPLALLLHELLVNAVKHRDPPDSTVRVRLSSNGQQATVSIENRGGPAAPAAAGAEQRRYAGLSLVGMMAPRPGTDVSVRFEDGCWRADIVLVPPMLE